MSPRPDPYRDHFRAVLRLGLPLAASHLAQFAIHLTDTVMLGWYDVAALAAVVLAASFFFVVFIVGSGFAWAVMPMVATALAEGDETQVRRDTRMGLWLSVLYGLAILPAMIWSRPLLLAAGQTPELAGLAGDYLRIAGWGMVPALLVMVLKSYLSALEKARIVLWSTVMAAVLNALVNWALIFGNWGAPELGVRGAAIASIVSQLVPLAVLALYVIYAPATRPHALFQRIWRADWPAFRAVFRLGWPIGLTSLAETGLFAATAVMMGWLGTAPLAAHGIALEISAVTFMVHVGLSQAATVRAGGAFGRRDPENLWRGAVTVLACSLAVVALTVVMFLALPELLIGLFLDPDDPEKPGIVAIGTGLLAVAALFQVADATQVVVLGLLRGLKDTRVPMVLAALSYWAVGLPVAWVFGFVLGLGGQGVWLGLVVGLGLAAVTLSIRFLGRIGRLRRAAVDPAAGSHVPPAGG
jgi:MATE family multidrug resistance protein